LETCWDVPNRSAISTAGGLQPSGHQGRWTLSDTKKHSFAKGIRRGGEKKKNPAGGVEEKAVMWNSKDLSPEMGGPPKPRGGDNYVHNKGKGQKSWSNRRGPLFKGPPGGRFTGIQRGQGDGGMEIGRRPPKGGKVSSEGRNRILTAAMGDLFNADGECFYHTGPRGKARDSCQWLKKIWDGGGGHE